jgi:protein-ribulosamine 3-kinase
LRRFARYFSHLKDGTAMLPGTLRSFLEKELNTTFATVRAVAGGDINQAAKLEGENGRKWFLKYNDQPHAKDMFRAEALGLTLLGASRVIAVPKIHGHGPALDGYAYLLLDFVEPGHRNPLFWERFGQALANLHGMTSAQFGFAHDNFIGLLPQRNARQDTWAEFYTSERLRPQMWLARRQDRLDADDDRRLEKICAKLGELCPDEAPALIHGDLWSGNFLCNADGHPVLIDPAACYAHREMDLAMSRLFGGFDPAFYAAYEASWPLEPGFDDRLEIYQLYYLLVHVNLFGGGYVDTAKGILKRFGG